MDVPLISIVPFATLLLAIAVLPLIAPHFWHSNVNRALVALALAFPVIGYLIGRGQPGVSALGHALLEYAEFVLLLGSLYTVAGGIVVEDRFRPTPITNTLFLVTGALLANIIGTTGASMLLARPLFRINRPRRFHGHIPVFFIFVVSNLGGALTPLGDPPLFLGYLRGVDFTFTLTLWPHWLLVNSAVIGLFFAWDVRCSRRDAPLDPPRAHDRLLVVRGLVNVPLLLGIVAAVLLRSPEVGGFLSEPVREATASLAMLAMTCLSLVLTPRALRTENGFTWHALIEVAVLFLGIFITMVPALVLLNRHGANLGVTEPWQYFWATGGLSGFLDNAPTYLAFATIAAHGRPLGDLVRHEPHILQAISAGAVFLGAMTYIGNGPNFMVKAIAEEMGYHMPSFFGYLVYSAAILLPIFALVTWLFFV